MSVDISAAFHLKALFLHTPCDCIANTLANNGSGKEEVMHHLRAETARVLRVYADQKTTGSPSEVFGFFFSGNGSQKKMNAINEREHPTGAHVGI